MSNILLLTEPELAKLLQTSQRSLRGARQAGGLPYVQIGRLIRYRLEDVTAFLNRSTIANAPSAPTVHKSALRVAKHVVVTRRFTHRDRKAA